MNCSALLNPSVAPLKQGGVYIVFTEYLCTLTNQAPTDYSTHMQRQSVATVTVAPLKRCDG